MHAQQYNQDPNADDFGHHTSAEETNESIVSIGDIENTARIRHIEIETKSVTSTIKVENCIVLTRQCMLTV